MDTDLQLTRRKKINKNSKDDYKTINRAIYSQFGISILVFFLIVSVVFSTTSLVLGFSYGLLIAVLISTGWLTYHLLQIQKLIFWLKYPNFNLSPPVLGHWNVIFSSLRNLFQRSESDRAELSKRLAAFKRLTEGMQDGVIVIDKYNQIMLATAKAEIFLSIKSEQDKGKNVVNIIRHPGFSEFLKQRNFQQSFFIEDLTIENKALEIKLVPYDEQEDLLICRDITELKKLESEKKDFVANVSHELKTPLTVVAGFLETLKDIPMSEEKKIHVIDEMLKQTDRMTSLINDLFLFSKFNNKKSVDQLPSFNICDLVEELANEAKKKFEGKLITKVLKNSKSVFYGEKADIRSAFWNLINNAMMYTNCDGLIEISWSVENNGECVFYVKDNGIGIEAHHLNRLTERFYRVDDDRSRNSGGTGLGLSIVQEVASKYGGKLAIESELGIGSKFSIRFPLDLLKIDEKYNDEKI